jgi:hypothetical protein
MVMGSMNSQNYNDFTKPQRDTIHQQWNLDNWDKGGELSRYTFLNMTEFWTHAVINKKGISNPFTTHYLPELDNIVTHSEIGELPLKDYINVAPVDAMIVLHNDANAQRHEWVLEVSDYQIFEGIKIPSKMTATWKLPEGDWTWLKLQIDDVTYNSI